MDPVAEERARLYCGRYPTDKQLSVLEFIERSLGIYLQRPLRVHSQVLMESADRILRDIQFLSVLFRESPPRFVLDERSRFSILATGAFLSCKFYYIFSRRSKAITLNVITINYAASFEGNTDM